MTTLYLVSVWLHILAAMAWVGGMYFLVLVVVPWLRAGNQQNAGKFLSDTGRRFRSVGWVCFGVLLLTGTFNLWVRGVRVSSFTDAVWLASPFGRSVVLKLELFVVVLMLSAIHDFVVGPRATAALREGPSSPRTQALRKQASFLGRVNAILALLVVAVAVTLVRGWP